VLFSLVIRVVETLISSILSSILLNPSSRSNALILLSEAILISGSPRSLDIGAIAAS